jgi:hypothetical protein
MSQTSIIAGALVVAFVVFVTSRQELPAYLFVLGIGSNCSSAKCCSAAASGTTGGILDTAKRLLGGSGGSGQGAM